MLILEKSLEWQMGVNILCLLNAGLAELMQIKRDSKIISRSLEKRRINNMINNFNVPAATCAKCNGTGYYIQHDDESVMVECQCIKNLDWI